MCLVPTDGPLYPPAYMVVAMGLAVKWACTRFAMRHWFGIPPSVDQDMMMSLRWRLGNVMGFSLLVQSWALIESSGPLHFGPAAFMFIGGSSALFLYTVIPFGYVPSLGALMIRKPAFRGLPLLTLSVLFPRLWQRALISSLRLTTSTRTA